MGKTLRYGHQVTGLIPGVAVLAEKGCVSAEEVFFDSHDAVEAKRFSIPSPHQALLKLASFLARGCRPY
jgi:hypothetical protein